jgi:hypothetical protein
LDRESCHLAPVLCHGPIARRRAAIFCNP